LGEPKSFPINVLFIDIEGGWGGSSRSLYFLIKHLDGERYTPIVLLGKDGPIKQRYEALGIRHFTFFPIPRVTAIRKGNLKSTLLFMLRLVYLPKLLWVIRRVIRESDVRIIHFNHESLFFLGLCCKVFHNVKKVFHVRTMLPNNLWARLQVRLGHCAADYLLFITENERDLWCKWLKKTSQVPHSVLHNIAETEVCKDNNSSPYLENVSKKFKILSLMTISYVRGTDRLVTIAKALKAKCFEDCVFFVCGKSDSEDYAKEIQRQIAEERLNEYFLFLGHLADPGPILAKCHMLIRPSREYNPWGRDVIEALALGKPVVAIGSYDKFVEDGVNGFLFPEFDAEAIAQKIIYLSAHPEIVDSMKAANIEKARRLFDGPTNAAKIEAIYEKLARA
jgi:glycosyltransferase involved in cell wall biosynthesis